MRVFTLVGGPAAVPETARLSRAIREFNAGVDFRLRFLHIEIDEVFGVDAASRPTLLRSVEPAEWREIPDLGALHAAAALALAIAEARPDLVVIVGRGGLVEPGVAAAAAAGRRIGFFGRERGAADGGLDLGDDTDAALQQMTGMAREIV